MKVILHTTPKLLIADENKMLRDINDVYIPEHYDENGNFVEEHKPYYSSVIFLGVQITSLEQAQQLYVEENV